MEREHGPRSRAQVQADDLEVDLVRSGQNAGDANVVMLVVGPCRGRTVEAVVLAHLQVPQQAPGRLQAQRLDPAVHACERLASLVLVELDIELGQAACRVEQGFLAPAH